MSLAAVASFAPVARKKDLNRLSILRPTRATPSDLWASVHNTVQTQLASIESKVRRCVSQIHAVQGCTKGEAFYLFSYRTFSMPDLELDPVVVGMTFRPCQGGVTLEADVSGEQTGDLIVSLPPKTVPLTSEALAAAVSEMAAALLQSAETIAAALKDKSRLVE